MKKIALGVCLFLLVSACMQGDLREFYLTLKTTNISMAWVDYGTTVVALNFSDGAIEEANPIARWYVNKPQWAIPITAISSIGVNLLTDWIWQRGAKEVAMVLQAVLFVVRGVVFYLNVRSFSTVK